MIKISPAHLIDRECSCEYCTKIDMLIGDPLLDTWERSFIRSLSKQGWLYNYTSKQKTKLNQIWGKILRVRKIVKAV